MTAIIEQINTEQLAAKLKELQAEFKQYDGLMGYLKAEPLNIDLDVNKDNIVIYFDLNQDTAITVEIKTDYNRGELVNVEISYIEVDSSFGTYLVADTDDNEMLHEAKRLIHDAVYYKLIDEDCEIETNFYDDVYA